MTDHLEGKLSLRRLGALQFHLGLCHHCRAYLEADARDGQRALGKLDQVLAAQPPSRRKFARSCWRGFDNSSKRG